ncbi:MAG: recombinase family protein, partial [Phycisphaerales bacterium]
MIPRPTEAPVRRLIYELFLQHHRKKTVARLLNEAGHRTRKGAKFTGPTIARLLRDPTAKGVRRANYTQRLGTGNKWGLKPESEWVFTEVDAIVSEDLWDQCNAILQEQDKKRTRPARKAVYLFTGFIYCHCGNKMYVPWNSPKYTCRQCRNKIPAADLEEIFHEQLKSFLFSSDEVARYLEEADGVIDEKQALLESLIQDRQRVEREMDKVYQAYIDEDITKEAFGKRYRPLEERARQIEDQIPELQAAIDFLRIQYMSSDEVLSEAKDLYSRWPQLNREEKRAIIEAITEKIVVGDEEITINLGYLPPSSKEMTVWERSRRDSNPRYLS